MALFRNFGVNLRNCLCGVQKYASAQFLDFLELAENCTFLDRKLTSALQEAVDGHYLNLLRCPELDPAVLGTAFGGIIRGHGLFESIPFGGQPSRVDTLVNQVIHGRFGPLLR